MVTSPIDILLGKTFSVVIKPEGRRDLYLVQPLSGGRVEIMQLLQSHFRLIVRVPES